MEILSHNETPLKKITVNEDETLNNYK